MFDFHFISLNNNFDIIYENRNKALFNFIDNIINNQEKSINYFFNNNKEITNELIYKEIERELQEIIFFDKQNNLYFNNQIIFEIDNCLLQFSNLQQTYNINNAICILQEEKNKLLKNNFRDAIDEIIDDTSKATKYNQFSKEHIEERIDKNNKYYSNINIKLIELTKKRYQILSKKLKINDYYHIEFDYSGFVNDFFLIKKINSLNDLNIKNTIPFIEKTKKDKILQEYDLYRNQNSQQNRNIQLQNQQQNRSNSEKRIRIISQIDNNHPVSTRPRDQLPYQSEYATNNQQFNQTQQQNQQNFGNNQFLNQQQIKNQQNRSNSAKGKIKIIYQTDDNQSDFSYDEQPFQSEYATNNPQQPSRNLQPKNEPQTPKPKTKIIVKGPETKLQN
jgi:hypothetical protein